MFSKAKLYIILLLDRNIVNNWLTFSEMIDTHTFPGTKMNTQVPFFPFWYERVYLQLWKVTDTPFSLNIFYWPIKAIQVSSSANEIWTYCLLYSHNDFTSITHSLFFRAKPIFYNPVLLQSDKKIFLNLKYASLGYTVVSPREWYHRARTPSGSRTGVHGATPCD